MGCKLHKNAFGAGLRPDPLGSYSAFPDPEYFLEYIANFVANFQLV